MLANALIFLLGLFTAILAALIVAPILWRKAQRFARRDFDATVPISANEIRAEFDRVRAEAALSVRRQEVLSGETRAKAAKAEAERGRITIENTEILQRAEGLSRTLDEKNEELAGTRVILASREEDFDRLSREIALVRRDAELTAEELEALGRRFRELTGIAEERKSQLVAAEAELARQSDAVRANDRDDREEKVAIDKLTAEIAALERTLKQERAGTTVLQDKVAALVGRLADREDEIERLQPGLVRAETPQPASRGTFVPVAVPASSSGDPASARVPKSRPAAIADENENADIRERISDIAARVIRMTALAEGPDSPIAGLLAEPAARSTGATGATGRPTLAERVRLLARGEGRMKD